MVVAAEIDAVVEPSQGDRDLSEALRLTVGYCEPVPYRGRSELLSLDQAGDDLLRVEADGRREHVGHRREGRLDIGRIEVEVDVLGINQLVDRV